MGAGVSTGSNAALWRKLNRDLLAAQEIRKASERSKCMLRPMCVMLICLATLPSFCQATSSYQVATILDVKAHQAPGNDVPETSSYDISIKVGNTIYLVLYTPPFGIDTVKYKIGHNLLVRVKENKITYNDILGQSVEVPIISQKPATTAR